ncbi:MAG TPA: hypothetical protein VKH19_04975 [Gemmatimonadaceae bacterium]|nr:hypothetical protein [Gemmatimonadaceae bacterium]
MRYLVAIALGAGLCGSLGAQEHAHAAAGGERLGTVHFATSCSPEVAERFNRAVALLHSFEFGAAIRGFSDVATADSTCAMAYWGIALSTWSNPMAAGNRSLPQVRSGQEAVTVARRLASRASARERGYVDAVAQLYDSATVVGQGARMRAYATAMERLAEAQPADTEARIFYAIALTAAAPPTDKTYANQLKAGQMLECIWAVQPDHPGLAHYIIHSYDVPALADHARAAARRYAEIAPSAAHAQHMPSHIFTRVGLWDASIVANQRSVEIARRDASPAEELHASDYMMYAYLQLGRDSAAAALLETIPSIVQRFNPSVITGAAPGSAGVFALAAMPARFALERGAWSEAARLVATPSAFPYAEAMSHFARALGAARLGRAADARASADTLAAIRARLGAAGEPYWAEQVAIEQLGAAAWAAFAQRDTSAALATMREATRREDATEKSPVTPGPLAPARELLGDMLMQVGRPREALAEYTLALQREPNRYRALQGAVRAATAAGDTSSAQRLRTELAALRRTADAPSR